MTWIRQRVKNPCGVILSQCRRGNDDTKTSKAGAAKWLPRLVRSSSPNGRFILAFGDIENATYSFLQHVPVDTLRETTSTLPLAKRIDLIFELLSGNKTHTQERKEHFSKLLRHAKSLSEKRNVLAHDPHCMEAYHHPKHGHPGSRMVIGSMRTKKKVSLERLRKQVRESESLAKLLYADYSRISKPLHGKKGALLRAGPDCASERRR